MIDLKLESRSGLPDALRVLLEDYPREAWEAHPNFAGLIEFWLSRHLMFRELLRRLEGASLTLRDTTGADPRRFASAVSHYGGTLVNQLHGHHQIEDQHYFPMLAAKDARIAAGFELLDADHHALDGHIAAFVEGANTALQALGGDDNPTDIAATFLTTSERLKSLLDRHLTDEEELCVPVVLAYGADEMGMG